MSTQADAGPSSAARADAPTAVARTRPYLCSVRREIWENRSIWIAPLAAAGFVLFGVAISLIRHPHGMEKISKASPAAQAAFHMIPYGIAIVAILITAAIVALFYCLGTLYNERRDRSILFWKSMPVSDVTTVLAKASIPMVVLPLIAFVVICATQLVMLLLNAAAATPFWSSVPLLRIWALLVYGMVALVLWNAPICGWLLVLSAWAKRSPFLWAALPPLAIGIVEKLAFDTSYFWNFVQYRLHGGFTEAFAPMPRHMKVFQWPEPDPAKFFSTPGLWLGLVAAAALFALAIWLRRRREPM
ncbi:MAG TPA: hypothetical protein VHX61_06960 [Rhizomicrobium sp.]|jgi:ABC-2 type transport system permease protein|nr:hypothetical protein [Rhizomicrobium sp.]